MSTSTCAFSIYLNKFTNPSTEQANTGTQSLKWDRPSVGHVGQFAKGSDLNATDYVAVSFFVYVGSGYDLDDQITFCLWDVTGNQIVGNSIDLKDFFFPLDFGLWQKITIPFSDLGVALQTFSGMRFKFEAVNQQAPLIYIDDIQLEEQTGSAVYTAKPPVQTRAYIDNLRMLISSDTLVTSAATGALDGASYNIDYSKFLGLDSLETGFVLRKVKADGEGFTRTMKNFTDLLFFGFKIESMTSFDNKTQIVLRLDFPFPQILESSENEEMTVTLFDNLVGLSLLQIVAIGRSEQYESITPPINPVSS
jgi:hypothetical protein